MGLSGKEGSVTTKFCWAVWRALIKLKSGSSRTLFASLLFDAISEFALAATLERFSFFEELVGFFVAKVGADGTT